MKWLMMSDYCKLAVANRNIGAIGQPGSTHLVHRISINRHLPAHRARQRSHFDAFLVNRISLNPIPHPPPTPLRPLRFCLSGIPRQPRHLRYRLMVLL